LQVLDSLAIGTLIGQLIGLVLVSAVAVVVVRFLLAATRYMNSKAEASRQQATERPGSGKGT
jgi:archaellin